MTRTQQELMIVSLVQVSEGERNRQRSSVDLKRCCVWCLISMMMNMFGITENEFLRLNKNASKHRNNRFGKSSVIFGFLAFTLNGKEIIQRCWYSYSGVALFKLRRLNGVLSYEYIWNQSQVLLLRRTLHFIYIYAFGILSKETFIALKVTL